MQNVEFTMKEMENMFELGRIIQDLVRDGKIEIEDSADAIDFALCLSKKFEDKYQDTENYYIDLYEFAVNQILDQFGVEEVL